MKISHISALSHVDKTILMNIKSLGRDLEIKQFNEIRDVTKKYAFFLKGIIKTQF